MSVDPRTRMHFGDVGNGPLGYRLVYLEKYDSSRLITQWDARTDNGHDLYIHYKRGSLSVYLVDTLGPELFRHIEKQHRGEMSTDDMLRLTGMSTVGAVATSKLTRAQIVKALLLRANPHERARVAAIKARKNRKDTR